MKRNSGGILFVCFQIRFQMLPYSSHIVQGSEGADDVVLPAIFECFVCGFFDGAAGFGCVSGLLEFAGKLSGIEGSGVRHGYGVELFCKGTDDIDDPVVVFVCEDAHEEGDFLTREVAGETVPEHCGTFRIMPAVYDDGGIFVHELESSVPYGVFESLSDSVFRDRIAFLPENFGCGDGHGGVCALVGAEERDEEIPDRCS